MLGAIDDFVLAILKLTVVMIGFPAVVFFGYFFLFFFLGLEGKEGKEGGGGVCVDGRSSVGERLEATRGIEGEK